MSKKPKQEKWVVVYKRVHKTSSGEYLSAYAHASPVGLEYKIGEITRAKIGGLFCLPDLTAARRCPEGNMVLKVLARKALPPPDYGLVIAALPYWSHKAVRDYWKVRRKGSFSQSYETCFYKEVIPVDEVQL